MVGDMSPGAVATVEASGPRPVSSKELSALLGRYLRKGRLHYLAVFESARPTAPAAAAVAPGLGRALVRLGFCAPEEAARRVDEQVAAWDRAASDLWKGLPGLADSVAVLRGPGGLAAAAYACLDADIGGLLIGPGGPATFLFGAGLSQSTFSDGTAERVFAEALGAVRPGRAGGG